MTVNKTTGVLLLCPLILMLWLAAGAASRHFGLPLLSPSLTPEEKQQEHVREILPVLTEQLNVDAPYMIDPVLRFDQAVADLDALRITYYNTFISLEATDTDFAFIEEHLPAATHYVRNEDNIRKLMSYGVSFDFVYREQQGVPVKTFTFIENDCHATAD